MSWSKIQRTELAEAIIEYIEINSAFNELTYHNIKHINYMYDYLYRTNESYNEALDWAVLAHDLVYDNKPDKEQRSAELFLQLAAEYHSHALSHHTKDRVVSLIMGTVSHLVTKPHLSPIVRADLAALANPVDAFHNYNLIMKESMNLYNISEYAFAESNIAYMKKLKVAVIENRTLDWSHEHFYTAVQRGINMTINISKMITGYNYGEI